jgi:hypothetical protein
MISEFSATAYECTDNNYDNLLANNLINREPIETFEKKSKIFSIIGQECNAE